MERVEKELVVEFDNKDQLNVIKFDLSVPGKENSFKLVAVLDSLPDMNIEIQYHTNNTGSESYNHKLFENMAAEVAGFLSERKIPTVRIIRKESGKRNPEYDNSTIDGQVQNRRIEFVIEANENRS